MEKHFPVSANLANFADWLHDTNLVVDVNDRDEEGVFPDGSFELVRVDEAVGLHRQVRHVKAFVFEFAARVEDAFVVDLSRDDMAAFVAIERCDTLETQVVRFCCTTGEDDLLSSCANEIGDLISGSFTSLLSFPAE